MASVTLDTKRITDWDSFHDVCKEAFGFPASYERDMDAWIDCLSNLGGGPANFTRFTLAADERLEIVLPDFQNFAQAQSEICRALMRSTTLVNQRYLNAGGIRRLVLAPQ